MLTPASRVKAFQAFTNSTSSVMVTSSPTRMPPVSSAVFQVRPKSLRLIFVVADTATRVFPQGSFVGGVGPSTEKSTLRVTPRMVRSPSTASSPSRTRLMRVDFKDIVGNFSTSKKSALFRCASRWASRVSIEAASINASTREFIRSDSSRINTPVTLANCPFTLEIIMCLTLNSATEWTGSRFQVLVAAFGAAVCGVGDVLMVTILSLAWMRYHDNRYNKYSPASNLFCFKDLTGIWGHPFGFQRRKTSNSNQLTSV